MKYFIYPKMEAQFMEWAPPKYTSQRHVNIMEIISAEGSDLESASLRVTTIQQVPFATLHTSAANFVRLSTHVLPSFRSRVASVD